MIVTSHAAAAVQAATNVAAADDMRRRIEQREGGLPGFRAQLRIVPIGDPGAGDLAAFYAVLRSGILADELVPIEDFTAALGPKNEDTALQEAIGPYHYIALAMRAPEHGTIGAAGFAVFCHRQGAPTMHASYYALLPAFRGLGLTRMLLEAAAQHALDFVQIGRRGSLDPGPMVQFIEVNDIAGMTLGDRLRDEAIGLHPLARDAMWENFGFREIIGVNYHQRHLPAPGMALKAMLVDIRSHFSHGFRRLLLGGFRPPEEIAGDLVLRHVAAFDDVLMNHAEVSRALRAGRRLPDPVSAGLVANLAPGALLAVKPPKQAAAERRRWQAIDDRLRARDDPPLDATMQALRDQIEAT